VIRTLSRDFIPVAMDCNYSAGRHRRDALRTFVYQVIDQRKLENFALGPSAKATQGYYVFDAAGKLYEAYTYMTMEARPELMLGMLSRALLSYKKSPPARVKQSQMRSMNFPAPPPETTIAHVYSRISSAGFWRSLTDKRDPKFLNSRPARDLLWIPADEIEQLLGGKVAATLERRLLLGHLRDNVRGQPRLFKRAHVKKSVFSARTSRAGDEVRILLEAEFLITAPPYHWGEEKKLRQEAGVEGRLVGALIYSLSAQRVTRLVMHAKLVAWGDYALTPGEPKGKYALELGFELAAKDDPIARRVPPHAAGDDVAVQQYLNTGAAFR